MRRRSATDAARREPPLDRIGLDRARSGRPSAASRRGSSTARTSAAASRRRRAARIASSDAGQRRRAARAWTSTLPSAVASTGPATTGSPARVGGELAEQLVLRAAADDVDDVDLRARRARPPRWTVRGVGGGERVEDAARDLGRRSCRADRRPPAMRSGMSPGGMNAGSSTSMRGPPAGRAGGGGEERVEVVACRHVAQALLEQPQPADVAQEAGAAVDAALVGEVGGAGLGGERPVPASSRPTSDHVPLAT